jgi:tetratricopeptide (TPR) repeat protein
VIELLLEAERALELGRVDAAETMFRQVADADPRNAIAVVGLARVAIEQGDEAEALELGRRALEIDPENAAAGRLVARLEEVIAYRGEDVLVAADEVAAGEPTSIEPSAPELTEPAEAPEAVAAETPETAPPESRAAAAPEPAKRRSWLDRLLRRNR